MTVQTPDGESDHIAHSGAKCPPFIAESVFDSTDEEHIHTVTFTNPNVVDSRGEDPLISMVLSPQDRGGVVIYDDGPTIYRRVFDTTERAVQTFRATIESIAAGVSREVENAQDPHTGKSIEVPSTVIEYSPGWYEPVEFDAHGLEVQD
jgi:hypothetical protein